MTFQWRYDVPEDNLPPEAPEPPATRDGVIWAVLALLLVALLLWGWGASRRARASAAAALAANLQQTLDLERAAWLGGDDELFLAQQVDDPAWVALQFQPLHQAFLRATRRAEGAETLGEEAWATVTWSDGNGAWQRLAFFRRVGGRWRRAPTVERFWGPEQTNRYAWGTLTLSASDARWADAMARFIATRACCDGEELSVRVAPAAVAARRHDETIILPSPRLIALDPEGEPGETYWAMLAAQLEPATGPLRYVVPDEWAWRYESLAADYEALTGVDVEILPRSSLPPDPADWLGAVDGARLEPTAALIRAGLIYDLTPLVEEDPAFAAGDFYAQIWAAAWWRERMWQVPAAAELPLIYYNRPALAAAGFAPPDVDWTWDDLTTIASRLPEVIPDFTPFAGPYWGLVDERGDTLWGVALNGRGHCPAPPCLFTVADADRERAWRWYDEVGQTFMPDLSELDDATRRLQVFRLKRLAQAGMWVGHAVEYEDNLMRLDLGLAPFPRGTSGSAGSAGPAPTGVTPLRVAGHVVSGAARGPQRAWDWIRFLSFRTPDTPRDVPARPSVAAAARYWQRLPAPLAAVMTHAFPYARPVLVDETDWLRW